METVPKVNTWEWSLFLFHRNLLFTFGNMGKFDGAGFLSENGEIAPQTDIFTGLKNRPSLANDNLPGFNMLAAKNLHAQALSGNISFLSCF